MYITTGNRSSALPRAEMLRNGDGAPRIKHVWFGTTQVTIHTPVEAIALLDAARKIMAAFDDEAKIPAEAMVARKDHGEG